MTSLHQIYLIRNSNYGIARNAVAITSDLTGQSQAENITNTQLRLIQLQKHG